MMNESTRPIPLYRLKAFTEQAENLRNKLLLWRLRNLNKIDLEDIQFGFEELKAFDKRVQQVVTPIYYLADKNAKKEILEFATQHQEETLRERREALDGAIFEAILEKWEKFEDVTVSMIHEKLGNEKLTAKRIGNIIRKVLQFDIVRAGHENVSQVILDGKEAKIKSLCLYYGLPPSLARVASIASVANNEIKDIKPDQVDQIDIQKEKFLNEVGEELPF